MEVIAGKIVKGHGVASGQADDPRFPEGTLALQWPYFEGGGLDLSGIFRGTVNISVAPLQPKPIRALQTFRNVKWHEDCPAEDFSFFQIRIALSDDPPVAGFIYWPHPETKPEHFHDPHEVEVVAPSLDGIVTGAAVRLWVVPEQIVFDRL